MTKYFKVESMVLARVSFSLTSGDDDGTECRKQLCSLPSHVSAIRGPLQPGAWMTTRMIMIIATTIILEVIAENDNPRSESLFNQVPGRQSSTYVGTF